MRKISIVIPTYNEEANILPLVERIDTTLKLRNIPYEIIFVDDHSTDQTQAIISRILPLYPVSLHVKKGEKGKAFSLLEGFTYAKWNFICMIDADLQYPPEAIPEMIEKLDFADIIVANRNWQTTPQLRYFLSRIQTALFNGLLHGISCDVQSGLKVFKKEIIERIPIHPSEWTFDLEFLLRANEAGYTLDTLPIPFYKREFGNSKIAVGKASLQIAYAAIKLKFSRPAIIPFHPINGFKKGKGFHYKGREFLHHSDLPVEEMAFFTVSSQQKIVLFFLSMLFIGGLVINWHITIISIFALLTFFYFIDLLFNFSLVFRNFSHQAEITIQDTDFTDRSDWPRYTIFCPLYKEAAVLPQFVKAIQNLDYPQDKLQILLLLEENDAETLEMISTIELPNLFEIIIIPHSSPKTKPKALNYGLSFATGEYAVIYDAEDIPDAKQLKKAIVAFERSPSTIGCIQAKLNFYNPHQNLLTKLFTAEYSLWFDLILTGLQSLNAPLPLGGTSNHFRTKDLIRLRGWDSFNVTEDCDLGLRLSKQGYQTAIVNSTTYEEANSNIKNWFYQRGRWIKGYMQSYLVHMRNPQQFYQDQNGINFIYFQLVIGGKILSLFVNPLLWSITIIYFVFRSFAGNFIQSFFPPEIFYIGVFTLVFGNFIYLYSYMIAAVKREQYSVTKYTFFVPLYWLFMSLSAWSALYTMIFKPHYWAKTTHGLHLKHQPKLVAGNGFSTGTPTPISSAI
ncbi:MAG TPA: glycosyltransferase [Candidatus Saccharimonadales bacterium]|nr:glycosyltransferase [Candidatus Saccharimonadales bacterium]